MGSDVDMEVCFEHVEAAATLERILKWMVIK